MCITVNQTFSVAQTMLVMLLLSPFRYIHFFEDNKLNHTIQVDKHLNNIEITTAKNNNVVLLIVNGLHFQNEGHL